MNGEKKFDIMKYFSAFRIFVAIIISSLIMFAIIFFISDEPLLAISKMLLGPFETRRGFFNVIERALPLIFTGLALNVSLKAGVFNLAIDGSFYMGAVIAAFIAIKFPMPNILHQIVLIVAAGIIGGIINLLPVLIGKYTKVSPTVLGIMSNSIFYYLGLSIVSAFLLEKSGSWGSYYFEETARLGKLIPGTNINYGFLVLIAVFIFVVFLMEKSSFGYKVRLTGENANFSKYMGFNTILIIMGAQFIGGFIGGMGGAIEMVGMYQRFQWQAKVEYVWDGLLVYMLADQRTKFVPLTAMFIAYLRVGAEIMSRAAGIDPEVVAFLQGIVILLVASERFLYFIKSKHERKKALQQVEQAPQNTAALEGGK